MPVSFIFKPLLLFSVLFALIRIDLCAQNLPLHTDHIHHHPVFSAIEAAGISGEITPDQAMLQKIYAGYRPDLLDARFKTAREEPVRCMTPVLIEYYRSRENLRSSTVSEIESVITTGHLAGEESHLSPSGNFTIHYTTEGEDAVPGEDSDQNGIPDYVERAAFAADSSYRYQVEEAGFTDFRRSSPYRIELVDTGGIYGDTRISPDGTTTIIRVHNDFETGFPPNDHPGGHATGALYATIAHEIKHAVQYANNRWEGQAGSFNWIEMDATMMEEVVFDDVNDYYNYIKTDFDSDSADSRSLFGAPHDPIPGAYYHVSWMLYFFEQHGIRFWVDVWEQFRADRDKPFLDAMDAAFLARGIRFDTEHLMNHLWHAGSGPVFATSDSGFEERGNYPNPEFSQTIQFLPDSVSVPNLRPLAANYFDVTADNVTLGQPSITLESDINGVGVGVTGYFSDGTTRTEFTLNPDASVQLLQTTWSWAELSRISVVVVNTGRESGSGYHLKVETVLPEENTVSQNYPNPFSHSTRIDYSVKEAAEVKLEVYDSIGRKVATLVNERKNRGFYSRNFNAPGLASGVYFYRLTAGNTVLTEKMVLIK